jgi:hypothetical protein
MSFLNAMRAPLASSSKHPGSAITEAQAIREFAKFVKAFGFGEALTPADQHAFFVRKALVHSWEQERQRRQERQGR